MQHKPHCALSDFPGVLAAGGYVCTCSQESTPGHQGKVCPEANWLGDSLWTRPTIAVNKFFYGEQPSLSFAVKHCPGCGIRLEAEPEPLPKCPEGHTPEETRISNTLFGLICRHPGGVGPGSVGLQLAHIAIYEYGEAETRAAWRKLMSKP